MRVSVVIPVYNAAAYVTQAVESALDQPETAEVILVEDGSPDDSLAVCDSLAGSFDRVRLLRHPGGRNEGAGDSRNLGIVNSRFEFVSFLDADDYYLPGRFRNAVKVFEKDALADGVYDAGGFHFEDDKAREQWFQDPVYGSYTMDTMKCSIPPEHLFEALVVGGWGGFHVNAIVVRRELFERTGLFDGCVNLHEDTGMWIKMAALGRLLPGSLTQPVALRRIHSENRITKAPTTLNTNMMDLDRVLKEWSDTADLTRYQKDCLGYRRWRNRLFDYNLDLAAEFRDSGKNPLAGLWHRVLFLARRFSRCPSLLLEPSIFRFMIIALRHMVKRHVNSFEK